MIARLLTFNLQVEEINVNHVHCQTDISSLIHVDKPIFNKCFQDELSLVSTCHLFILENTLADDLTPIYIETDSQTFESGGFVTQSQTQTEFGLENLNEIIVCTDNVLSHSIELYNEVDISMMFLKPRSVAFTQTIITEQS